MKEHTKRAILYSGLTVLVAVFISWGIYSHDHPSYSQLTTSGSPTTIERTHSRDQTNGTLEYDFAYKAGCPHCESIEPFITPKLERIRKSPNKSLIVENVRSPKMKGYLLRNQLTETPTLSVRYNGYLIYRYTGTDRRTLGKMLRGINPSTGQPFKRKDPRMSTIVDGSIHSKATQPAIKTRVVH